TDAVNPISGATGQGLGRDVAVIGDVNNDGMADFAVLSRGAVAGNDSVTIYAGGATNSLLAAYTLTNFTASDYRLLSAGDVDGDLRADLLLTSKIANSYLILGGAASTTIDNLAAATALPVGVFRYAYTPAVSGETLGGLVPLGDIDGDSKADLG